MLSQGGHLEYFKDLMEDDILSSFVRYPTLQCFIELAEVQSIGQAWDFG